MFLPYGVASREYILNDSVLNLENPLILIIKEPIKDIANIIKPIEFAKSIDKPLVIFSPEIRKEPLSVLLYNKKKANYNVYY
jgi:chaperonin GroEL (HSP60 family)